MRLVRFIIPVLLLNLLLDSCSSSPLENQKGLAVSAHFSDSEDIGSELSAQKLWIFDSSSGELICSTGWNDSRELASTFFSIPQGSYLVVLGANLDSPLTIEGSDSPQSLSYTLDQAVSRKVFSACAQLEDYTPSRIVNLNMNLSRVTAELTVEIKDAPEGLETSVEVSNCAAAFYPAEKNAGGEWGRPSDEIKSVTFRSESALLLPTAAGSEFSKFHLSLRTPEGSAFESIIEAPRMEAGSKYLMSLKYDEIQPFMRLDDVFVSDWHDGQDLGWGEISE